MKHPQISTIQVEIKDLIKADYNPRKWDEKALNDLKTSIKKFGLVDPIIINKAENRKNVVIGGHMRIEAAKALGIATIPAIAINIPEIEREKELNLRLNKNHGEFDFKMMTDFAEDFLADIGFTSEELDQIFEWEDDPETFDLDYELEKLNIERIVVKPGDVWQLGEHKLMCGDSTNPKDVEKLMNGEQADMCFTDPPYILDYLHGKKKNGKATEGFGYKRDRRYIGTDVLPDDFTELWMKNIADIAKKDFHIIVYENWKNIRIIWDELEKYWKVKNMLVWHIPNRNQGYAATYKFFSKYDIAIVSSSNEKLEDLYVETEDELLQNEYETAMYAVSGKPAWEGYKKGKKFQPTDFIEYKASDEKSSGQGIVFGTKPVEIIIPYIKVLTKRGDLVVEPFGGSGSTLMACEKMKRKCYTMEKCDIYAEVIKNRWEKLTKMEAVKIS